MHHLEPPFFNHCVKLGNFYLSSQSLAFLTSYLFFELSCLIKFSINFIIPFLLYLIDKSISAYVLLIANYWISWFGSFGPSHAYLERLSPHSLIKFSSISYYKDHSVMVVSSSLNSSVNRICLFGSYLSSSPLLIRLSSSSLKLITI